MIIPEHLPTDSELVNRQGFSLNREHSGRAIQTIYQHWSHQLPKGNKELASGKGDRAEAVSAQSVYR
jgi:hypothetical protein